MRLIDADALKEYFKSVADEYPEFNDAHISICHMIDNAPTVGTWIPCSEREPVNTGRFKVTFQIGSEMGSWRETGIINYRYVDGNGEWILPKSDWLIYCVIAWTDADEPYKGE